MSTINERIRKLREEKGISQEELAFRCGYSGRSAISKIEKGNRDIKQTTILKIANALGVTPDYLILGEESGSAKKQTITIDELKFALFGGDISDEALEDVIKYAEYVKEKNKKE